MKIEKLAAVLARDIGRGVFLERRATTMILKGCLQNAGLPNTTADVIRLEDMIDNLCEEAWNDWQRKQDMRRTEGRSSVTLPLPQEQQP